MKWILPSDLLAAFAFEPGNFPKTIALLRNDAAGGKISADSSVCVDKISENISVFFKINGDGGSLRNAADFQWIEFFAGTEQRLAALGNISRFSFQLDQGQIAHAAEIGIGHIHSAIIARVRFEFDANIGGAIIGFAPKPRYRVHIPIEVCIVLAVIAISARPDKSGKAIVFSIAAEFQPMGDRRG